NELTVLVPGFAVCHQTARRPLGARGAIRRVASRRDFRRGREAETPLYWTYCKFRRQSHRRKDQARRRDGLRHGLLAAPARRVEDRVAQQIATVALADHREGPLALAQPIAVATRQIAVAATDLAVLDHDPLDRGQAVLVAEQQLDAGVAQAKQAQLGERAGGHLVVGQEGRQRG